MRQGQERQGRVRARVSKMSVGKGQAWATSRGSRASEGRVNKRDRARGGKASGGQARRGLAATTPTFTLSSSEIHDFFLRAIAPFTGI